MFYVFVEVMVFKIIVIICKVYGGVYCVMVSKYLCIDVNFVYLMVEIVVMGFEGVVNIFYCCEFGVVDDVEVLCIEKIDEYCEKFLNFYVVVECGFVDVVIELC